jgi:predicted AAA+ superfamily ATPase
MSFSHAQSLNLANVARECEVKRKTVSGYLEVLEDLLLSFRLPVFTRRARREPVAHPKFYFFDAGVFASLRPKGPLDRPHEIAGPSLEGLVAQHLRAWASYSGRDVDLFHSRTRSGSEVDFVVYGKDGFWALEVKNGRDVHREDLRSLKAFRQDYPECEAVFLYRGSEQRRIDDIACIPVDAFLRSLQPSRELFAP